MSFSPCGTLVGCAPHTIPPPPQDSRPPIPIWQECVPYHRSSEIGACPSAYHTSRFTLSPQAGGCRLEAGDERRDTRDACSAASHRNEALASPLRTMVDGSQLSVVSSRIPRDAGCRNTLHASRFTLFPQAAGCRRETRYEIRDTRYERPATAPGRRGGEFA